MKVLVGYTTKEGQTRRIARHICHRAAAQGHAAELLAVKDAEDIVLSDYDCIILAAPVHVGHYPKPLVKFAKHNAETLKAKFANFLSISLAAAGHDAEDWRALDKIVVDFSEATGWHPNETKHVAGAYLPSKYDPLTGFIMRRIVSKKDADADLKTDRVYTDWDDLDGWFDELIQS